MSFSTLPAELKYEIINQIIPTCIMDESTDSINLKIRDLFHVSLLNSEFYYLSKLKFTHLKAQTLMHLKINFKSDTPSMPKILAIRNMMFVLEEVSQNSPLNEAGSMLLDALSKQDFSSELNHHIHLLLDLFPESINFIGKKELICIPFAAACLNRSIPIEIIRKIFDKTIDPSFPIRFFINNYFSMNSLKDEFNSLLPVEEWFNPSERTEEIEKILENVLSVEEWASKNKIQYT